MDELQIPGYKAHEQVRKANQPAVPAEQANYVTGRRTRRGHVPDTVADTETEMSGHSLGHGDSCALILQNLVHYQQCDWALALWYGSRTQRSVRHHRYIRQQQMLVCTALLDVSLGLHVCIVRCATDSESMFFSACAHRKRWWTRLHHNTTL